MNPRAHKSVLDAAETDILIGWCTGIAVVALRVFALVAIAMSDAAIELAFTIQVLVQFVLAAAFTYGVYRRQVGGAIGLLVLWGIGWCYSWYASARLLPPLGLIGIAVWYGLYRGLRGTRAWRALRAEPADVAPAA